MGSAARVSLAAMCLLLAASSAAGQAVSPAALAPLEVALGVLPQAVRLAIAEAEEQLRSDQAQRRLDEAYAYVQGFSSLPAGAGALADPGTRQAYAWVEEVIATFASLPAQLDAIETAGSICRSYGQNSTAQQVERAHTLGTSGQGATVALRSEVARLQAEAPASAPRPSFDEAAALLDAWMATKGVSVHDCLQTLPAPASIQSALQAVLLPAKTFPTGQVRIVGTMEESTVSFTGDGLALSRQATASNGTFRLAFTVPRAAALGVHTITLTAGSQALDLLLTVEKAEVTLRLQVPSSVVAETAVTVRASLTSPAGLREVDRVPLTLQWRQESSAVSLDNGSGTARLAAGPPASLRLVATYPGSDILKPATAEVPVTVFIPGGDLDPYAASRQPPSSGASWVWWLFAGVLAVLGALVLLLMPVALHRLRGWRGQALRGNPSPPRWPGATSFTAAMGALFDLLRRRRLAPPGQTVREWLASHGGPPAIADRFEAVRYGGQAEDEALRKTGLDWARKAWDRWRMQ